MYVRAGAMKVNSDPSSAVKVTLTSSPGFTGAEMSMIIRWSPPGASSWLPPAASTNPPSFGRMTISPASFFAISCSSIFGEADVTAETKRTSESEPLTSVPNTAVIPESTALIHGSVTVIAVAPSSAGVAPAAGVVLVAAASPTAGLCAAHAVRENASVRPSALAPSRRAAAAARPLGCCSERAAGRDKRVREVMAEPFASGYEEGRRVQEGARKGAVISRAQRAESR